MKSLRLFICLYLLVRPGICPAQGNYNDSLQSFINNYVDKHEIVTGDNKKYLSFYPINKNYRVVASFQKVRDNQWFTMKTSGKVKKTFRVYGTVRFAIHDTTVQLNIYQSQDLMERRNTVDSR